MFKNDRPQSLIDVDSARSAGRSARERIPISETQSAFILFGLALLFFVWEKAAPARVLPRAEHWWKRVAFLQVAVILIITVGVSSWQETLLKFRLLDGAKYFGPFWGGVVSYLAGTFVFYWWHRLRHENDFCWRAFHQMHHSPSRIQSVTAFYVHPVEAVASSLLNAVLVFIFFGLGKEALTANATLMGAAGIFYHSNIRTPAWLGWFVQRPEAHARHHELGVHAGNYGDITLWDRIFGTLHNPVAFDAECGFGGGRELRFFDILRMRDVNVGATLVGATQVGAVLAAQPGNSNEIHVPAEPPLIPSSLFTRAGTGDSVESFPPSV